MSLQWVDLETARGARGVRLVVAGALPSPWSEAAKALVHVKQIPALAVRYLRSRDQEDLAAWTGARNVPVVLYDDEPPRTGWAEILALAERLGGPPLVPGPSGQRIIHHGLVHELAAEGGLAWCSRLLMIHGGVTSDGARGFPLKVAQFLAPRYGYEPDRVPAAQARIREVIGTFAERLDGRRYLLEDRLTALDLYLATFLTPVLGVSEEDCPGMRPELRAAFAYLRDEVGALPPAVVAHRAGIFERHLPWPIEI